MMTGTHNSDLASKRYLPPEPIRRDTIRTLARDVRARLGSMPIDDVADSEDIILIRTPGPIGRDDGLSEIRFAYEPVFIESIAVPGSTLPVWGVRMRRTLRVIYLNQNSFRPEREVFWHEYYHVMYSPFGIQRADRFRDLYSTEAALHHQEERRANDFAAAMLVPTIEGLSTVGEICERYGVSELLAKVAVRLHASMVRK